MRASIIIRTYNEERHLDELLTAIAGQTVPASEREVLVVDSGSTDLTHEIVRKHGATLLSIARDTFSFGRSLNIGCAAARGKALVFISGHCVPADARWLASLIAPIEQGLVAYAYGRQLGGPLTKFSEQRLFEKYFPATSNVPQEGFFINNANAALQREAWERFPFDEELTGLEDMDLGKRLVARGERLGYVADAAVFHHHDETWPQVKRRYEREAIALQRIMPEVHLSLFDFFRYFVSGVLLDWGTALRQRMWAGRAVEIVLFRFVQFWGAYKGNHIHRHLSRARKDRYFYPR